MRPPARVSNRPSKRCLGSPGFFLLLLACALTLAGARASGAQDVADRKALVARMREAALSYANQLQDFICMQVTTRSADRSGSGKHWKRLEVQEQELSYVAHKENYKLLRVDGHSVEPEKRIKPGYARSSGEFGTALKEIFDPKANAEFTWDHEETTNLNRLCAFRYQVPQASSAWIITADSDKLIVGHHGLVYADCETGSVLRLQIESEPASVTRRGKQVAVGFQLDVRYGPTMIGSKDFLLPQSAVEIAPFGKTLTKAEIQFKDYRKFRVDTRIMVNEQEGKSGTTPKPQN